MSGIEDGDCGTDKEERKDGGDDEEKGGGEEDRKNLLRHLLAHLHREVVIDPAISTSMILSTGYYHEATRHHRPFSLHQQKCKYVCIKLAMLDGSGRPLWLSSGRNRQLFVKKQICTMIAHKGQWTRVGALPSQKVEEEIRLFKVYPGLYGTRHTPT